MMNGEVNIAAASEFVYTKKILTDEKFYTFGTIDKVFNEYIIARKDRGITKVADLSGKKIGVAIGTAPEFYVGRFLEINGVNSSDITLINVSPQQSLNALQNGTVDAVIAWEPYVSEIEEALGGTVLKWEAQEDQLTYFDLHCTVEWVKTNPELIARFLKSLSQAESYLINNPDQAKNIIQAKLGYSREYVDKVWPAHKFGLSLDQSLVLAMQDESRWLINSRLTNVTSVPIFMNYIYTDGLNSVKPESVTIIR